MKITIDLSKLHNLVKDSDKILFSPDGENTILQILELKKTIEDAEKAAKKLIETAALKLDKNFTSVQSDNLRVSYRAYGSRYKIDISHIEKLPVKLYKVIKKFSPIPSEIDEYADEKGLPLGIIENEREKKISFSVKK